LAGFANGQLIDEVSSLAEEQAFQATVNK